MISLPPISTKVRGSTTVVLARRGVRRTGNFGEDYEVSTTLKAMVPETHLVKNGFPFLPSIWVETTTGASASGLTYLTPPLQYGSPYQGAHTRFLFNSTFWDEITGVLHPVTSAGIDYSFTSSPESQPRLEDMEYRSGKKLLNVSSMRFDPGDHLVSSFNSGRDNASVVTIGIACRVYGTQDAVLLSIGDSGSNLIEVRTGERVFLRNGVSETFLDTRVSPGMMHPMYLILTNAPDKTIVSVGHGSVLFQRQIPNNDKERKLILEIGAALNGQRNLHASILDLVIFNNEVSHRYIASRMYMMYQ